MNYFIDFEATQFSKEIISVGCVREDGETFYALVAPTKGEITPFITNLTGITEEMLETAFSADQVFESFYNWVFSNSKDVPEFYVWGTSDNDFIQHTCHKVNSLNARMALGYIAGSMRNYAKVCKKYLKWETDKYSLLKTLERFDSKVEQNHNALDDAMMLKRVYDFINKNTREELLNLFNDWTKKSVKNKNEKNNHIIKELSEGTVYFKNKNNNISECFKNIDEAVLWIKENKIKKGSEAEINFNYELTKKKILHSCRTRKKRYYSIKWFIV